MVRYFAMGLTGAVLAGCGEPGCLTGNDPTCTVPSACENVAFTCDGGAVTVKVLEASDLADLPLGNQSLASVGDILLSNDKVWLVIDAIDHPHLLADTGGTIIDMGTWDGGEDTLQQIFQVSGLLPAEAAHYTDVRIIDDGDNQAVQFIGYLAGDEDLFIATRYEMHPCDPGVRVRTEMVNRSSDPRSWMMVDAFWWGGRGALSYSPQEGGGFTWPDWGLLSIADGFVSAPYMAGGFHDGSSTSFATVGCDSPSLDALHSEYVSAAGTAPFVIQPRDYEVYERFITAGKGPSISAATDPIFEIRKQLFDEDYVALSGQLMSGGEPVVGNPLRASIQIIADGANITHVIPDEDGRFTVNVPAGVALSIEVEAFGQSAATFSVAASTADVDAGTLDIPEVGGLLLDATVDGETEIVLAFLVPADDATQEAVSGDVYGHWRECAPLLGLPHGRSPACNRVLVEGETSLAVLPGTYDIYATVGPFSSLAAVKDVVIVAGESPSALLEVVLLPLQPEGTLSGDFHVHGGASWDAGIEDYDRVRAFLAADIDVIVSTEHNVAWNYADAIAALNADERVQLINGTENTGLLLFDVVPDTLVPKVTGHWNFWPVTFDATDPYRGSWWDQKAMPGQLFNRAAASGWPPDTGIIQLNHPTSSLLVGRDFGWADTVGLDLNRDLVDAYDGSPHSLFADTPEGTEYRNSDFHSIEVMNGTSNEAFEGYRAIWWWMLNQGMLRSGTANSDSHTLRENVLGTPRTIVWTDQVVGPTFDVAAFNASVRDGRMVGTNGPLIEAVLIDGDDRSGPSLTPMTPGAGASLHIEVSAAPWVPVSEVRIIVNGVVVDTLVELSVPSDPLSTDLADLQRLVADVPLANLLPPSGDAWIVLEAGLPMPLSGDLNCDGIPDTGDTNGDGTVDWRDVEGAEEAPETPCSGDIGPRASYPVPERGTPLWLYQTTVVGGYPSSFTNPWVIDVDGNGFEGVVQ